jgi:membrane-associated phospholipid phosphatase
MAISPLSLVLVAYAAAAWVSAPLSSRHDGGGTNRFGAPLHVNGPADVDRAVFGAVPSVWLQARLVDGTAHWYDAVAALTYVTHFLSMPLLTVVAWFWLRDRYVTWLAAVLSFTVVGIGIYTVYPAAPPWLASDRGLIGTVDRISSPGWDYLHLRWIGELTVAGQKDSNPVAAMPSLHAGTALLVALFLWPVVGRLWRAVLLGYALLMALTLVYTGEHYVVDVVAGWLTAVVALLLSRLAARAEVAVRRRRSSGRASPEVRPPDPART